jgi:hypothetical protein
LEDQKCWQAIQDKVEHQEQGPESTKWIKEMSAVPERKDCHRFVQTRRTPK